MNVKQVFSLVFPSEIESYFCLGYRSSKAIIFSSANLFLRRNLQLETFQLSEVLMGYPLLYITSHHIDSSDQL